MQFSNDPRIPAQPYPELEEVLRTYVDALQDELAENLVGIYLVGSIASGDFDADSDIDFLVITKNELTEDHIQPLEALQSRIHAMGPYPARHLEGSFISIADLNDWDAVGVKEVYYFDNGSTRIELSTHDNRWHVLWILRERGIPLIGPDPQTLCPPIPREKMAAEIKGTMIDARQMFADSIEQPLDFNNSRFGQSFYVLTYCRMLHSLHTGRVESKKAGMHWSKQVMEPRWVRLIEQAWEERKGVRFGVKIGQRAELELLNETLAFIDHSIAQIDHFEGMGV